MDDVKLGSFGWYLSEEGLAMCQKTCEETSRRNMTLVALEMDLRSISKPSLPPDINRKRRHQVEGPLVLQVQKVKNVAVPSSKQHDSSSGKRLLRLQLTDGHAYVSATELEGPIEKLSPDTPPGTKLRIKGTVAVVNGFMLLKKSSVEVLGGKVEGLHKKWSSMKDVPNNMDRTKEDGEDGPPRFVKFGSSGRIGSSNKTGAAPKIKDKSVEKRQPSPIEEVSTREKMELPQSYHTQGVSDAKMIGEAMRKDPIRYPSPHSKDAASLSKDNLSSQIKELSLDDLDIENIGSLSGEGFGHVSSSDQGSMRDKHFSAGGESRHRVWSKESGDRTRRPPMEGGGREGRGRGRRRGDTDEDDYYLPRRKEYLLSDYLTRPTSSSDGGSGCRARGSDNMSDNTLDHYIYDKETDRYYPKETTDYVGMDFSKDETSAAKSSRDVQRHDTYPNRGVVEYDSRMSRTGFSDCARGRRRSGYHGGHVSQRERDNQETSRGWGSGGEGYVGRGYVRRGNEGKSGRKGSGRGREQWSMDDSRVRQEEQWPAAAREEHSLRVSRKQGKGSYDGEGGCGPETRGREGRYGGQRRDAALPSSHHSIAEPFSAHSVPHRENRYGMKERETFRAKESGGENERKKEYGGRMRPNRENYTNARDDYRKNTHMDRSTRMHDARGEEDVKHEEQERVAARTCWHPVEHCPVPVPVHSAISSSSSHWEYLEQTGSVPATAVKKSLDL